MLTALIDYESGNLHSAHKAFERMAQAERNAQVVTTQDPDVVRRADRIVLPGDGAFPACKAALMKCNGMYDAMSEAIEKRARPFMGICVGMQMMAQKGYEYAATDGFGWIKGEVRKIAPCDSHLKIPHMGWNDLQITEAHPVLAGISSGDHAYFVHSYHMALSDKSTLLAFAEYGAQITAIVGRDTMIGTQFHPEKSQKMGLRLIENFLNWRP